MLTGSQAYDERYGFRSIKNAVNKRVVNVLAQAHEREQIVEGSKVFLSLDPHGNVVIAEPDPAVPAPKRVINTGNGSVATVTRSVEDIPLLP
jgi:hypothetical protein